MLNALYQYAVERQLALPVGFVAKTVKAFLCLGADGRFLGLERSDGRPYAAPDIGSLANSTSRCNPLVEKAGIVVPEAPGAKSDYFQKVLEDGTSTLPALGACLTALRDAQTLEAMRREVEREKIKPGDRVTFLVDGANILEIPGLVEWWQAYRVQFTATQNKARSLCLITGQPTVPMETVPPISGLGPVGGHPRGDALICFDKDAFCSYGLSQAANAPVSETAYAGVKAALDELLKGAPILAGMKFVHWYDRALPTEEDALDELLKGFADDDGEGEESVAAPPPVSDEAARARADALPRSVYSGMEPSPLPDRYYILLLSGVNGRVMIRRYEQGAYEELQRKLSLWHDDLSLCRMDGVSAAKSYKLNARLYRLMKRQESDKTPYERAAKELAGLTPAILSAILGGGPLPDAVAARALAYIRSQMMQNNEELSSPPVPDGICCQWLKAWLIRRSRIKHQEEMLMPYYNPKHPSNAYQAGALVAVYAAIQRAAMPDVNASMVQRYYGSASQTPALALGRLAAMSNHHQEKLEYRWQIDMFSELLNAASVAIGDSIPTVLNLEGQAYFALGYRQMSAEISRRENEARAQRQAKRAERTTKIEEA